jgi:hypothetical protein
MDAYLYKYISAAVGRSKALAYVGANTGQELPDCKLLANQIYAFEPITVPEVWAPLMAQADSKTHIFDVALSDQEGTHLIYPASKITMRVVLYLNLNLLRQSFPFAICNLDHLFLCVLAGSIVMTSLIVLMLLLLMCKVLSYKYYKA